MKKINFLFLVFFVCTLGIPSFACDDFYLEWKKLEESSAEVSSTSLLGVSEAVARLKSALNIERIIHFNWPNRLKVVFIGWGQNEKPADPDQVQAVKESFALFFPESNLDFTKIVDVPDFEKMKNVLASDSTDLALSVIVKDCRQQWKNFLTKDISSIFKLRIVLQEFVEAEFKLVNSAGEMVFLDRFSVKPSLLFDFNYETSGLVEMNSERYGADLIMNIIADPLAKPLTY